MLGAQHETQIKHVEVRWMGSELNVWHIQHLKSVRSVRVFAEFMFAQLHWKHR